MVANEHNISPSTAELRVLCLVPIIALSKKDIIRNQNLEKQYIKNVKCKWLKTFSPDISCISVVEFNQKHYVLGYGIGLKYIRDQILLYSRLLHIQIEMECDTELPLLYFTQIIENNRIVDNTDAKFCIGFDQDDDSWVYIQKTRDSRGELPLTHTKQTKQAILENGYHIYSIIEH